MKLTISALLPLCAAAFAPSTQQNHAITTNTLSTPQSNINANTNADIMQLQASMTAQDLPEKLYFPKEKELPKVLGGIKIGTRKLTVITGASSGLGLNTAKTLVDTGRHFVVMAVRDVEKAKRGM